VPRIISSSRNIALRALLTLSFLLLAAGPALTARTAAATVTTKPFGLPFATPPGPSTWLFIQGYGNTTTAYRWRVAQYAAGQGLHFGLDFAARCGTPIVAIGDGVVTDVDNLSHGAGPHNLIITHPNGYASLYGHLLQRPQFAPGNLVKRGQVVALTGDPDLTCNSRPHLHLEIRTSPGLAQAVNPILLIDANWDALAVVGGAGRFERDLNNPRQWQYLDDQPDVTFGGKLLNDYAEPWPMNWNAQ
jgi:murein DD-endopeptidase MepM/ murein hydrolase activator NlpD